MDNCNELVKAKKFIPGNHGLQISRNKLKIYWAMQRIVAALKREGIAGACINYGSFYNKHNKVPHILIHDPQMKDYDKTDFVHRNSEIPKISIVYLFRRKEYIMFDNYGKPGKQQAWTFKTIVCLINQIKNLESSK